MKHVVILGSTGSIGTQTLQLAQQYPDKIKVLGLSAASNMKLLAQQIQQFTPSVVCVGSDAKREELQALLSQQPHSPSSLRIVVGSEGLYTLSTWAEAHAVVVGIVGFAGLAPTLQALKAGKQVLTANKETFVTAGHLVTPYLSQIVPLDSEHSAIFQCLQGCTQPQAEVRKLYLTASGGPFRAYTAEQMKHVTVQQALQHPNWVMGQRVTIDSATMMNKGLEVIEAQHLFGLPLPSIEVVVHPQSIVHSAVAFQDGSILAQLGQPDMRVPILYGLSYPQRWVAPYEPMHLDLPAMGQLQFEPADAQRFPCLALARAAAERGGSMPVVLNAADEVAVEAFLNQQIAFRDIPRLIDAMLNAHASQWCAAPQLADIEELDVAVRQQAQQWVQQQAWVKA